MCSSGFVYADADIKSIDERLIVIIFWLPETLLTHHRKVFRISIIRKYRQIGKNPVFFFYNTSACALLSYLFLFCSASPCIIIR